MTVTSLWVPMYHICITWGRDILDISLWGIHIFCHQNISPFGCHISRHLIIWLSHLTASHHLAVTSHGISHHLTGCHISRSCQLSYLTASHHLAVTSHGITSFGCHISRHLIIMSHLTTCHQLGRSHFTASLIIWLAVTSQGISSLSAVISHGTSSFGCHISRHLIIRLSYLTVSHYLAVISHGISSTGCHISRHLRFHDISWGKIGCSNSSLLECSPSTAQARVRSQPGQSRDLQ